MIVNRPTNRMIVEAQRKEDARRRAEENGEPIPISTVGNGRAGTLFSTFHGATGMANGR